MKTVKSRREWFTAGLRIVDGSRALLSPRRGCTRVYVEIGETVTETSVKDSRAVLRANVGDELMLFGRELDEIQLATVSAIGLDGYRETLTLLLGYGQIASSSVHVIRGKRAAVAKKRSAA